ncbi:MAG TPA: substrate-binding domain-containing protein [Anaerolineae bacterium]|nr:substrate-binding domain-containing protein [Anaerolineae bacterium]
MKPVRYLVLLILAGTLALAGCGTPAETPTAAAPTPVPAEPTVSPAEPTAVPVEPTEAPAAEPGPAEKPLNLIFVQHALCAWDSFWCTVENGINQAAADMKANVTILGPDQFDLEKVAQLIDQAVAANPDGIGLTVTDPDLFREPIQRALDAGIPVVAYNAGSGPVKDNIAYMTYLGQDEYQGGYQGGQRLGAGGGTQGVCINHQVGHAGLDARCNGFLDAMQELGIPAEVLAISNDPAESQTIISDYTTANPDTDVFLTLGPNGANPFYAFLDAAGLKPGDVKHGTFDLSPEIAARIKDGTTLFGIDQQPFLQGYGAVQILTMVKRYGITPALPVTSTGPGFIDASNVDFVADPSRALNLVFVQHALCAWDSFWCVVQKGIETAAAEMNANVTVLGPDQFDLEKVAQLIDQGVAANPDGIALTVTDPDLFREPIQGALDAGIPVVAYNAGSGPVKDNIAYMTYLGQDEYAGGYQGGQRLAAGGGTQGVCINHQVGHAGLDARCNGFLDAMEELGIPAEVLAISNDPAESQTIISDYTTANPDTDVFLTLGPNGANPFYAFLDAAGLKPGDVKHGTFDLSPEIIARIKDGTTLFGIDQQPFLQGYGAVQILVLKLRYGISPAMPVTPTGPGFVDKGNVEIVEKLAGTYR